MFHLELIFLECRGLELYMFQMRLRCRNGNISTSVFLLETPCSLHHKKVFCLFFVWTASILLLGGGIIVYKEFGNGKCYVVITLGQINDFATLHLG